MCPLLQGSSSTKFTEQISPNLNEGLGQITTTMKPYQLHRAEFPVGDILFMESGICSVKLMH